MVEPGPRKKNGANPKMGRQRHVEKYAEVLIQRELAAKKKISRGGQTKAVEMVAWDWKIVNVPPKTWGADKSSSDECD